MKKTITFEIIITLPDGEVICRQFKRDFEIKHGHCPKLAEKDAKRLIKNELRNEIKVEFF